VDVSVYLFDQDEIVFHSTKPDWAQGPAQRLQRTCKVVRCSQGRQGNWAGCKDVPESKLVGQWATRVFDLFVLMGRKEVNGFNIG
jgi:hypothetical protein